MGPLLPSLLPGPPDSCLLKLVILVEGAHVNASTQPVLLRFTVIRSSSPSWSAFSSAPSSLGQSEVPQEGMGTHSQDSDQKLGDWREMMFAGAQMLVMGGVGGGPGILEPSLLPFQTWLPLFPFPQPSAAPHPLSFPHLHWTPCFSVLLFLARLRIGAT